MNFSFQFLNKWPARRYFLKCLINNDANGVKECLEKGINPNQAFPRRLTVWFEESRTSYKWTNQNCPLLIAVINKNAQMVEALFKHGADPNFEKHIHNISLMSAAYLRHQNAEPHEKAETQKIIDLFIDYGARAESKKENFFLDREMRDYMLSHHQKKQLNEVLPFSLKGSNKKRL